MDFRLTSEQEALRKKAADFAKEYVEPVASELDEKAQFPHENVKRMADLGFWACRFRKNTRAAVRIMSLMLWWWKRSQRSARLRRSSYPRTHRWQEVRFSDTAQMSRRKNFFRIWLRGRKIGAFCLTEPDAGTDASRQLATAVDQGDHYVLNAHKKFITNGGLAGTYIVFALTDKSKGNAGISTFIVDGDSEGIRTGSWKRRWASAHLRRRKCISKTSLFRRKTVWGAGRAQYRYGDAGRRKNRRGGSVSGDRAGSV